MPVKLFPFVVTAALLVLPATACGQAADSSAATATAAASSPTDADPALWVVKDDDTTIYLFGTVHVLKPGLSWFDNAVKTAFDASDELVMELIQPDDPASVQQLILAKGITTTGPTLTERLPVDKRAAYARVMTANGLSPGAFDRMDPWLAAMSLTMTSLAKLGYEATHGPEQVLTTAAQAAGKPITALETIAQQFDYLDGLSEPAQMTMLASTIDATEDAGTMFADMVAAWSNGDDEALAALMNEGLADSPELERVMLTDRNARWADWIAGRMKQPGTVFVAVGAGHLAGENSVRADLAKHHLIATRIAY
ncbi:TraB/GumN family protein [Hephaestia sp. GCM10023244]|uniref:TraB/GumN family protein n=1 Tax=Hephaestia sp. GCM10023244 TaxID=3252641 RepID=UPI00362068E8|nr:TraB/GumN family protein [Hephaestia sp. MAHUQ-44]